MEHYVMIHPVIVKCDFDTCLLPSLMPALSSGTIQWPVHCLLLYIGLSGVVPRFGGSWLRGRIYRVS